MNEEKDEIVLVENQNGTPMTTSRIIANVFNKEHKDVIRKIKEKRSLFNERNFTLVDYVDNKGERRPMYLLDRDFATYLIMGFTGTKADEWKLKYIQAFNMMEEKLKSGTILSEEEKLKLMLFSKDPVEVAMAHNKLIELATAPLTKQIEQQQEDLDHKEDVIVGLVDEVELAEKRQILNQVVRYNHANYQERWGLLYKEFDRKYHIDTKRRMDSYNASHKPKMKNKLDYIDKVMGKVPELYEIAVKLYETDIKAIIREMYATAK